MNKMIVVSLLALFTYAAAADTPFTYVASTGLWANVAKANTITVAMTPYAAAAVGLQASAGKQYSAVNDPENPVERRARLLITDNGFEPGRLLVQLRMPLRLEIRNLSSRTQTFVLPEYNIYSFILKKGEAVVIQFTPDQTGNFRFFSDTCPNTDAPQGKMVVR